MDFQLSTYLPIWLFLVSLLSCYALPISMRFVPFQYCLMLRSLRFDFFCFVIVCCRLHRFLCSSRAARCLRSLLVNEVSGNGALKEQLQQEFLVVFQLSL